jgi:chromate transporter
MPTGNSGGRRMSAHDHDSEAGYAFPREPLLHLFLRFLRFGALAWGGPVAQIGMLRHELVEQERWLSPRAFNRALAMYQVLPGPEAHELCVYMGYRARGRIGGLLAGLGFMAPGFVLMFAVAWAYVTHGVQLQALAQVFAAVQAVVAALVVRAVIRIGGHVATNAWLWTIAALAMAAQLAGVHFGIVLLAAGALYALATPGRALGAWAIAAAAVAGIVFQIASTGGLSGLSALTPQIANAPTQLQAISPLALLWSGLKAGLLTFGGAYTVIPFLQRDAVVDGGWMSNSQFLDGVALTGLLPAPLVILATFVGYLGGGPWGAVAMTAGVFLPAFAFTLLGHDTLERLLHREGVHRLLEGVSAGVVGLIAGTAVALFKASVGNLEALVLFALALAVLFAWKGRMAIPVLILAAALWGWV